MDAIDVVKIAREYVGLGDVANALVEVVQTKGKKMRPLEKITALGSVMVAFCTYNHILVEDLFGDMVNQQARMIRTHKDNNPDCDAFPGL